MYYVSVGKRCHGQPPVKVSETPNFLVFILFVYAKMRYLCTL